MNLNVLNSFANLQLKTPISEDFANKLCYFGGKEMMGCYVITSIKDNIS